MFRLILIQAKKPPPKSIDLSAAFTSLARAKASVHCRSLHGNLYKCTSRCKNSRSKRFFHSFGWFKQHFLQFNTVAFSEMAFNHRILKFFIWNSKLLHNSYVNSGWGYEFKNKNKWKWRNKNDFDCKLNLFLQSENSAAVLIRVFLSMEPGDFYLKYQTHSNRQYQSILYSVGEYFADE